MDNLNNNAKCCFWRKAAVPPVRRFFSSWMRGQRFRHSGSFCPRLAELTAIKAIGGASGVISKRYWH
jgi:hypothetical protein